MSLKTFTKLLLNVNKQGYILNCRYYHNDETLYLYNNNSSMIEVPATITIDGFISLIVSNKLTV